MSSETVTFEFDKQLTATIDSMRDGKWSRALIIQRSIALLKLAVDSKKDGEKMYIRTHDGKLNEIHLGLDL